MGFKRLAPNIWLRFKNGFKFGRNLFLTLFGVYGTTLGIITATGKIVHMDYIVYPSIAIILICTIATFISGHLKHLPDEIILDDLKDEMYTISFCKQSKLEEANALTKVYYKNEYVINEVALLWFTKNPNGFVQILNSNNELCACFGILALEKTFMAQFIKGRVIDNDMKAEDVLNFEQSKKSSDIYISGVVVNHPYTSKGRIWALILVYSMLMYIKKVYGLRKKRNIYALAVSRESENILKKSGFKVCSKATERIDKLNLYKLEFDKNSFANILRRIPDYSRKCKMEFDLKS